MNNEIIKDTIGAINKEDLDIKSEKDRVGLRYTRLIAIVGLLIVGIGAYIYLNKKTLPAGDINVNTDQQTENGNNDANQTLNF